MTMELLLCFIIFPPSVSWMVIFSHMVEYSFVGFAAGICFGFLYVLMAFIFSLYLLSSLAVFINLVVGGSRFSYPDAQITLIFACSG